MKLTGTGTASITPTVTTYWGRLIGIIGSFRERGGRLTARGVALASETNIGTGFILACPGFYS